MATNHTKRSQWKSKTATHQNSHIKSEVKMYLVSEQMLSLPTLTLLLAAYTFIKDQWV